MHIAFVITRGDAVGGATIHVRDMALALVRHGCQATVLMGPGPIVSEFARLGIAVRSMSMLGRSIHPAKDFLAVAQIASALRQVEPDIVSTHTAKAGWLGRLAARVVGLPALFTPHGWSIADRISPAGGKLFRFAERVAAPLAHTIVNVCEAEKSLALAHCIAPAGKLEVIHNGVVDVDPTLRAAPCRQPPRLIMVARFEPPKNHVVLLRALSRLKAAPWTLQLAGGGPLERETRRLAQSLDLDARIEFTGSTGSISSLLSQAQIFVLTSRSEGFPRSILEAMRAGLPVVASGVGGVSEAVINGTTGIVVPREDPAALCSALGTLIGGPDLRGRMGAAARRRYETSFTFQHMFDKTLSLYEAVLSKAPVRIASPQWEGK